MKFKNIIYISIGYIILYGAFELLSRNLGDNIDLKNSLLICAVVIVLWILIEKILFKENVTDAVSKLGLKLPYARGLIASVIISIILFLFYPIISWVTVYIPTAGFHSGTGVFISHGIAEELIFQRVLI